MSEIFPAAGCRETGLGVTFAETPKHFLSPLLETRFAHGVMLAEQDILSCREASPVSCALNRLDPAALCGAGYDGSIEDPGEVIRSQAMRAQSAELSGALHFAAGWEDAPYRGLAVCRTRLREAGEGFSKS